MTVPTHAVLSHLRKAFLLGYEAAFTICFPTTELHNSLACQPFRGFMVLTRRRDVWPVILDPGIGCRGTESELAALCQEEVHEATLEDGVSSEPCVSLASLGLDLNCHMVAVTD